MSKLKKRISILLSFFCLLCCTSCAKSEEPESFAPIYSAEATAERDCFFVDTFEYVYYLESGSSHKKTGYRIMRTDPVTGQSVCACIDPLCPHDVASGCPVTSDYPLTIDGVANEVLLFRLTHRAATSNYTDFYHYNLLTGESRSFYRADLGTITAEFGSGYLFIMAPDVVEEEPVYSLTRYNPADGEFLLLDSNPLLMVILAISNQRIYYSSLFLPGINTAPPLSYSIDYEGKNRRKETEQDMNFSVFLAYDVYAYGTGINMEFRGYNIQTDTPVSIGSPRGVSTVGYWEKENRIVYPVCAGLTEASSINPETYCEKHGISMGEYQSSMEYPMRMEAEREALLFGTTSRIMCSNPDGSGEHELFTLPAGCYIESGIGQGYRAGCVSGDYMYVNVVFQDSGSKKMKINLVTGEMDTISP